MIMLHAIETSDHFACDAGPGVVVLSAECRWCLLEKARIHSSDKVLRSTEQERIRAKTKRKGLHIGDAICDGGSLKWQIYKPLHSFCRIGF